VSGCEVSARDHTNLIEKGNVMRDFAPALGQTRNASQRGLLACLVGATAFLFNAQANAARYFGEVRTHVIQEAGCNASSPVQIPGTLNLFLNRQLLTAAGQVAGISGPNDCSGGDAANEKNGGIYNRWALTVNRLDWDSNKLVLLKTVLDTSIDPSTKRSRAFITGGPTRGGIIQSAYDPDVVLYRGIYFVSFECVLANGDRLGVHGTSSCVGRYDPNRQEIDLSHTQVVVSGVPIGDRFQAAAVPELLVFEDRLFIYWSSLTNNHGVFERIAIRGAELELLNGDLQVKGSYGHQTYSADQGTTVEVWAPDPNESTANTAIDLRAVWSNGKSIIAMAGVGGGGCAGPGDKTPGCFRLMIAKAESPLGDQIFNRAEKVDDDLLPTNPQEYTRPLRGGDNTFWFVGHYFRPPMNGFSEKRPIPAGNFWSKDKKASELVIFPIEDRSIWPSE